MPSENKKQLLIIVGALIAGIIAVALTSNYVKTSIQTQTAALSEQYDARQKEMVSQLQQRSEQQMAALSQQIQHDKAEMQEAMQKQAASLQAAQQEAERLRMAQQAAAPKKVHKPSLALKTPVGKRAVTVKIASLAAVGGLLNAGDFVDVIAELKVPGGPEIQKTVTAMVFQGLQVLAINTNENEQGDYDTQQAQESLKITFAVDPQEAGLLSFADKNGQMQLALRSPDDTDHQTVKANTWRTLADYVLKNQGLDLRNPDNEPAAKIEEGKPSIQIFRGGKEL